MHYNTYYFSKYATYSRHTTLKIYTGIYTVEFQKRDLAHAHILLFLHQSLKKPAPDQIDRVISAEYPIYKMS